MKIAIVAPSPVPFTIGGAENVWWGLLNYINQATPHQADLIKLPSRELSFWELIDTYWHFSQLDLSHFDLVISSKYPSWMVRHPQHVCYMLHCLRGLYDTYHFTGLPQVYDADYPPLVNLVNFLQRYQGDRATALKGCFEQLANLRFDPHCPASAFQFPGPLIRQVLHFLDQTALAPSEIQRYTAISYNVSQRPGYFPAGVDIEVAYPPSNLSGFYRGNSDYLLTVGRLDSAKRIGMLIKAMKYVRAKIPLKIVGTGPDGAALKQLAGDDSRIEFLGFINDQDLVDLYANAMAVLYAPYDEDYGLVTLEAMMSGKPVITTIDAGGPLEFVHNGKTGYIVPTDPQAIAERIDYLYDHPHAGLEMGLQGQKQVQSITWETVVRKLLAEQTSYTKPRKSLRRKLTVAVTFPIYPPRGGGQSRIFHLYRHLAQHFDVELVTLVEAWEPQFKEEIAPGLWEIRIPKSQVHETQEREIEHQLGTSVTDVLMPRLYSLTPAYLEVLQRSCQTADFVIACHPYLLPAIQAVTDKPLWYEAQDVEADLKQRLLPDNELGRELLEATRQVERDCCQLSSLVLVCSAEDGQRLGQLYNVPPQRLVTVPNGVDLENLTYNPPEQRLLDKERLGLQGSFTALFMGSAHGPNFDAARQVLQLATQLPRINFLLLGSISDQLGRERLPANVRLTGLVDEDTKEVALSLVDVALNPMRYGSGTNLKMLDYFAAGVPVVSTPVGVRGLEVEHRKHCIVAELDQFYQALVELQREDMLTQSFRVENARRHVEAKFDWAIIANQFWAYLNQHLEL